MGRTDKALITLGSKTLLGHVVERAMKVTDKVTVVIGREGDTGKYKRVLPKGVEMLQDTVSGCGPVVGILTGAQTMKTEYTVILPCDTIFVEPRLVDHLFQRAEGADAAIPRWPKGYIEPLHSVYRLGALLASGDVPLKSGNPSVRSLIKRMAKVVYVPTSELRQFDAELLTFFNINTSEDLKSAHEILLKLTSSRGDPQVEQSQVLRRKTSSRLIG